MSVLLFRTLKVVGAVSNKLSTITNNTAVSPSPTTPSTYSYSPTPDKIVFMSEGVWYGSYCTYRPEFKDGVFIKWEMFVEYNWDINSERILFFHKKDESAEVRYPYKLSNFSHKTFKALLEYFVEKSGINKMSPDNVSVVNNLDTAKRFLPENRKVIIVNSDTGLPINTDLPVFKVSEVKEKFQFPPSHPMPNTVYAMAEMFPNTYWTLNEFHAKLKQMKQFAFIELCATLGAKDVFVENIEVDNQSLDVHGDVNKMLTSVDVGFTMKRNSESGELIAFSFGENNKEIKPEYNSPWIATEPSWLSMNEMRRKFHLQTCQVEYNYSDDMGVDAHLEAKLSKIVGIKIDRNACKMRKVKLNFRVEFW